MLHEQKNKTKKERRIILSRGVNSKRTHAAHSSYIRDRAKKGVESKQQKQKLIYFLVQLSEQSCMQLKVL